MKKTAVIGAGLIGQAWAIVFARAGCDVSLWDDKSEALRVALRTISKQLSTLESHGLVSEPEAILSRIKPAVSLVDSLLNVDYIQENLPEILEVKSNIFRQIDAAAPPKRLLGVRRLAFRPPPLLSLCWAAIVASWLIPLTLLTLFRL